MIGGPSELVVPAELVSAVSETTQLPFRTPSLAGRGVQAVSGLSFVTARGLKNLFALIRLTADLLNKEAVIRAGGDLAQIASQETLERFKDVRELRGEQAQAALTGAQQAARLVLKGVSLIPIVGYFATSGEIASDIAFEGAKLAEKTVRQAEQVNVAGWKKVIPEIIRGLRMFAPYALSGVSWTSSKGEQLAEWLERCAHQNWDHPEVIEEFVTNLSDCLHAFSWKLTHFSTEAPIAPQLEEEREPELQLETFKALSKEDQNDILFLVEKSKEKTLGHAHEARQKYALDRDRYRTALYNLQHNLQTDIAKRDQALQEVISAYIAIPKEEKYIVTPRLFQQYDALTKIHCVRLVREYAKTLLDEERKKLLSAEFRRLSTEEDWNALSVPKKKELEQIVIKHFNLLDRETKNKLYNITREQYSALSDHDKKLLFDEVKGRVEASGSQREKMRFEELNKRQPLTLKRDISSLLAAFQNYMTVEEKIFFCKSLSQKFLIFRLPPNELREITENLKIAITKLEREGKPAAKEKELLGILQAHRRVLDHTLHEERVAIDVPQAEAVAAPVRSHLAVASRAPAVKAKTETSIQLAHIQAEIGPHNVQEGAFSTAGWCLGWAPRGVLQAGGGAVFCISRALGYAAEPYIPPIPKERLSHLPRPVRALFNDEGYLKGTDKGTGHLSRGALMAASHLIDTLTLIPGFYTLFGSWLQEMGIPLQSIDDMIIYIPIFISRVPSQLAEAGVTALSFGKNSAEGINNIRQLLEEAKPLKEAGAILQKSEEGTQALQRLISETYSSPVAGIVSERLTQAVTSSAKEVAESCRAQGAALEGLFTNMKGASVTSEIRDKFCSLVETQAQVAGAQAQKIIAERAEAALQELREGWLGSLKVAAVEALPQIVTDSSSSFEAVFRRAEQALRVLGEAAELSHEGLKASLKAQRSVEKDLENFFAQQRQRAEGALQQEEATFLMRGVASFAMPALDFAAMYLTIGGATSIALPFVMTRVIPPLLRAAAPVVGTYAKPFWYGLGAAALEASTAAGKRAQDLLATPGGWMRRMYNVADNVRKQGLRGWYYVDPVRVENFYKKLSEGERKFLLEFVAQSNKLSDEDRVRFTRLLAKYPAGLLEEERTALATLALQNYDKQSKADLLKLTPSYFLLLDTRTQERIIDIVEKYDVLSRAERKDPAIIVQKFNALTDAEKGQIDDFTIWDYGALSIDEQEDIRFILAESSIYKFSLKAQERGVFAAAWGEIEEVEPISWSFEQFQNISRMSNNELRELLPLLGKLDDQEKSLLTPSLLRAMSPQKRMHAYNILRKYHPEYIEQFRKASRGKIDLRYFETLYNMKESDKTIAHKNQEKRLLVILATLFNKLEPGQKREFLTLTKEECQGFSHEEKRHVIRYMLSCSELASYHKDLKQELIQLELGKINEALIVKAFNQMRSSSQMECRGMKDAGVQQNAAIRRSLNEALEKITIKLRILERKRERLSHVNYFALKGRLNEAEGEQAKKAAQDELDAVVKKLRILDQAIEKDRLQKQALERMVGKTPTVDILDEEPSSMEQEAIKRGWMQVVTVFTGADKKIAIDHLELCVLRSGDLKETYSREVINLKEKIDIFKAKERKTVQMIDQLKGEIQKLNEEIRELEEKIQLKKAATGKGATQALDEKLIALLDEKLVAFYEKVIEKRENLRLLRTFNLLLYRLTIEKYMAVEIELKAKFDEIQPKSQDLAYKRQIGEKAESREAIERSLGKQREHE